MTDSSNTSNFRRKHKGRGQKLCWHFTFQSHPQHPPFFACWTRSSLPSPSPGLPAQPQFGFPGSDTANPNSSAWRFHVCSSTGKSSSVCSYFCLFIPPSFHSRLVTTTCHFLPFSSLGHHNWHMANYGKPKHKYYPPAAGDSNFWSSQDLTFFFLIKGQFWT